MKSSIIQFIRHSFSMYAPIIMTKVLYRHFVGHRLNLRNPQAFTEKIQWLKLYCYTHNELVTGCIDKYLVRKYVTTKGCKEILNDLIGVWDSSDQIPWDELPEKFVLKCNHGCSYNIICTDKKTFNIQKAKTLLDHWLNETYGLDYAETIYYDIKPKIICEKYIEPTDGKELRDYKIFCSYGEPKLIYVITGGHGEHECLDYYTTSWNWIPVNNGTLPNAGDIVQRPEKLDELLNYARMLSKDFPIVRVDLYYEKNSIIFGELTFLPTAGFSRYSPEQYDYSFGKMFDISSEIRKNKQGK